MTTHAGTFTAEGVWGGDVFGLGGTGARDGEDRNDVELVGGGTGGPDVGCARQAARTVNATAAIAL